MSKDNLGIYPWTGGNCYQDLNFTPTLSGTNSIDFNTTFATFNYSTVNVPQFLELKIDAWEDDLPSDNLLGFCNTGTACEWNDIECCGVWVPPVYLFGVLIMVGNSLSPGELTGNLAAFTMPVTFAVLILVVRKYPSIDMVPAQFVAGICCCLIGYFLSNKIMISYHDIFLGFLAGFFQIGDQASMKVDQLDGVDNPQLMVLFLEHQVS